MKRSKLDHDRPVADQAKALIEVFGARAYGVARRMQRRNFRKPERARYWAAVARAVRHTRADDRRRTTGAVPAGGAGLA